MLIWAELTRAPHPLGSPRQAELATWLGRQLNSRGVAPVQEAFTAVVPNSAAAAPGAGPIALTLSLPGVNVWGFGAVHADAPCVVALASHYDTKSSKAPHMSEPTTAVPRPPFSSSK